MPNNYLSTLWTLWKNEVLDVSLVIKALEIYGYQLNYLGNGGIKTSKENETYGWEYGRNF
jgi:hypothetical protein